MKIILTILCIASCIFIAGCVKATNDYNQFRDYHTSGIGFVTDFLIGYSAAQEGDPLGPITSYYDLNNELAAKKNTMHFWAWLCVLLTFFVSMATKKKPA